MDPSDPRGAVEAPIRRAMTSLMVRGLLLVAVVLGAVLVPGLPALDPPTAHATADAAAAMAVGLLVGYGALLLGRRLSGGRLPAEALARAWPIAREVDPGDATLALLIAGWVPVALAVTLAMLAWTHLTNPNLELRGAWAIFGMPALVGAWIVASEAWLDACRETLASAEAESTRRFRSYWANPAA